MTRSGFVALIGEPNAGKSTLLNQMVGAKISIVTHKVQTTRTRIRGVSVENQSQIIFVDTPGLFTPRRRLDRAMVAAAWNGAADSDITLLMVEAHRGLTEGVEKIISSISEIGKNGKLALVINKIDKVNVNDLLSLSKEINDSHPFVETFMISAEKGKGINDLRLWLASNLPEGPWLYPDDQISDMPLRMIAAEITREKLTLRLHQELPYQLTVETEKWEEKADKSVRIEQIIYLSRPGHKGIVLGKKGDTIKAVSMASRLSIENQSQIIFVDTPGLFIPRRRLDRAMVAAAWNGAADSDITLLMVEAHRGLTEGVEKIISSISEIGMNGKIALVINKIDKVKVNALLSLSKEINVRGPFVETFMISAEKGKGINDLRRWLASNLPEGPWLYPDDQISDMPLRMIAAEITREKLTLRLHQELPYQLTVETEKWEEKVDKSVRIEQIIYLSRSGHKGIVLGKKGETIKAVSMASRLSIEEFLGARVHLFLRLKVREKWMEETERYSEMGLDFKDGNV